MTLQEIVHDSLDNAMDSGYFSRGMPLHGLTNEEIAEDLMEYDSDLEDRTVDELIPYIQSWWQKV